MVEDFGFSQQEILRACLGRQLGPLGPFRRYVAGDLRVADMGERGTGAGQADEHRGDNRCYQFSLPAAPFRQDRRIVAALAAQQEFRGADEGFIFTVQQANCPASGGAVQVFLQSSRIVSRDAVCRAGEHLEEAHSGSPQLREPVGLSRPRVRRESVVHVGPINQVLPFGEQIIDRSDRLAVGMLNDRGDTGSGGSGGAGGEVLPFGAARIHQMDMGVNPTGQDQQTAHVGDVSGGRPFGADAVDAPVNYPHVGPAPAVRGDNRSARQQEV